MVVIVREHISPYNTRLVGLVCDPKWKKEGLLAISSPINGLAVLTGEKRTIPIWKICNDNMTVKPAEKRLISVKC